MCEKCYGVGWAAFFNIEEFRNWLDEVECFHLFFSVFINIFIKRVSEYLQQRLLQNQDTKERHGFMESLL